MIKLKKYLYFQNLFIVVIFLDKAIIMIFIIPYCEIHIKYLPYLHINMDHGVLLV